MRGKGRGVIEKMERERERERGGGVGRVRLTAPGRAINPYMPAMNVRNIKNITPNVNYIRENYIMTTDWYIRSYTCTI